LLTVILSNVSRIKSVKKAKTFESNWIWNERSIGKENDWK